MALFSSYNKYLRYQKRRALETLSRTCNNDSHRAFLFQKMREYNIEGRTMLCVGSRHPSEVMYFNRRGFETYGLDIAPVKGLIHCDMSRMYRHKFLRNRTFDIVVSVSSMEHCLDLQGFIKGLNLICKRYFVCLMSNLREPSKWDCARHPFMIRTISGSEKKISNKRRWAQLRQNLAEFRQKLMETFTKFRVVVAMIRGTRLVFILERKNE